MSELHNFLASNPVGLLFLVLGIGYLLGERYGCFLASLRRLGVDIPINMDTRFEPGDVLHVTGHMASLDRLGNDLGHIERAVDETDLVTFGLGIAVCVLIGGLSITVAGISIGVGSAGGLLAGAIVTYAFANVLLTIAGSVILLF